MHDSVYYALLCLSLFLGTTSEMDMCRLISVKDSLFDVPGPLFDNLDDLLLDHICERVVPTVYSKDEKLWYFLNKPRINYVVVLEHPSANFGTSANVREVRDQSQQKAEVSPSLAELLRLEEQAKQQGVGRWSKEPNLFRGFLELSSANKNFYVLDAMSLLAANKGRPMEAIMEQVRDGSTTELLAQEGKHFTEISVLNRYVR